MTVVPLVKETGGPRLAYRIAMGVRYADQEWKRLLNRKIAENQDAINRLLLSFGVPLLDDKDRPLADRSDRQIDHDGQAAGVIVLGGIGARERR